MVPVIGALRHEVVLADRTVSLGYLAGQSSTMITVRCVDGGTFVIRAAPGDLFTASARG